MQFGLDQDVPPLVMRSNESPKTAWKSYNRSITGMKLYIPPQLLESDVSSRHVVWWRGLLPVNEEMLTSCIQNEKHLPVVSWGHKRRRSRKSLSRKTEGSDKRNNLDEMLVLKSNFEPETPAKLICMTEGGTSSVWSTSSYDKRKEHISSTERPTNN
ncbi:hypothetical protein POM88_048620 [Heracleum sosnowskyi]|uniref:Aminotransferase-like plant mobile domain-containing protein n=1 Tax=Heracleum sosnowskyi TaxID=360622 RepID=A0AAD8GW53_9APIA|nr:hypothetical protein POM88_048620 [Heracleum sosnowskyi]